MKALRARLRRDTPTTGEFDWVVEGEAGAQHWRPGDPLLDGECRIVVPSELVTLQSIEVAPAQADRIGHSLRYLIEDRIISEPERSHVASARTARDRLSIAVLDREWFQGALARLRQAGLVARAAYAECLLPLCPPDSWTIVCESGEAFARTGQYAGLALGAVDAHGPGDVLRMAVAEARPRRIVLRTAPGSRAPDAAAWSQVLGAPIEDGAAWDWTHEWAPALDLLQGEFAPRAARSGSRRWRRAALLAAASMILFSLGIAVEWLVKSRQRAELLGEIAKLHRDTLGDRVPVVDPPAQMRQALAELRRQSGEALPGDFLPLLSRALSAGGPAALPRVHQLVYEGGVLSFLLPPADAKHLAAAGDPQIHMTTEPAQWGGQQAVLVKLRSRDSGWTGSR